MSTFRSILRQPDFFRLWIGQIISSIGDRFYQFALLSLVLGLNAGTQVGKESARILFIGMLPSLLFAPMMGWVVDRFSRRKVLIVSDLTRVILILMMMYLWANSKNLVQIYMVVFGIGAMTCLFIPARQAVLPQLVNSSDLVGANALISLIGVIANLFGAALASLSASIFGANLSFLMTAIGYSTSAYFLSQISVSTMPPGLQKGGDWRSHWNDVSEGARYLLENELVRWLIGLCALFSFISGFFAVPVLQYVVTYLNLSVVAFISERMGAFLSHFAYKPPVFDLKVLALGILLAGLGLGLGLGVLTSGRLKKAMHWKGISLIAILLNGAAILLFSLVHSFEAAWLFCVGLGWCGAMWMIPIEAWLQQQVQDVRRGRVFALRSLIANVAFMLALSFNLSGDLLRRLGPENMLRDLGCFLLVFGGLALWFRRHELKEFWD